MHSTPTDPAVDPDAGTAATGELVAQMADRIAELEARLDLLTSGAEQASAADEAATMTSRRTALRLMGAAAVGAVAAFASAGSAAADTDDPLTMGQVPGQENNISNDPTRVSYTGGGATTSGFVFMAGGNLNTSVGVYGAALTGWSSPGRNPPNGVYGFSANAGGYGVIGHNDQQAGSGVFGRSDAGVGVTGSSSNGIGVYGVTNKLDGPGVLGIGGFAGVLGFSGDYSVASQLSNKANLYLQPNNNLLDSVSPKTRPSQRVDTHRQGELENVDGDLWWCVAGGTPGTWRKLAGPTSSGAFHAISPVRAYDSRAAAPAPGILTIGVPLTISVAAGRGIDTGDVVAGKENVVPVGATAVLANVTVVDTIGAGYLAVNPGTSTAIAASTINWSSSGQILNNGVSLTLGGDRQVTIVPAGSVGSATHVVVDVTGYFL